MFNINRGWRSLQAASLLAGGLLIASVSSLPAEDKPAACAKMAPFTQDILGTDIKFEMLPIPGGEFVMGSPAKEANRNPDEGPQHKVKIEPFWMGKYEVTWDEYDIWSFNLDIQRRKLKMGKATNLDKIADVVTRPTKPYVDMTFDMGHKHYPAICMTQLAAKMYCKWLSAKTGHYYRLPTEAEWEYACRAGTTTAYSFGDDPKKLDEYAWHYEISDDKYHPVGEKKPNPWGLYDMHGNVSEWVLDQYDPKFYKQFKNDKVAGFPKTYNVPIKLYPRVARGGSWDDDPEGLRSGARYASTPDWKIQDPQIPQSIWYHTDALHVGFRVVRTLNPPDEAARKKLRFEPIPKDLIKE